jgi:hypothetical protein
MRMLTLVVVGVALVTSGSVRVSGGQMLPPPSPAWANQIPGMSQPDTMRRLEQRKMLMSERQKQLVADTDKLLALTTALKEQVDESNKDVLSLDMVKKADEIEKLAHRMKERIKG